MKKKIQFYLSEDALLALKAEKGENPMCHLIEDLIIKHSIFVRAEKPQEPLILNYVFVRVTPTSCFLRITVFGNLKNIINYYSHLVGKKISMGNIIDALVREKYKKYFRK